MLPHSGTVPVLTIREAGTKDIHRAFAAAASDETQRWLGWDPASVGRARKAENAGWLVAGDDPGRRRRPSKTRVDLAVFSEGSYVAFLELRLSGSDPESQDYGPEGWQVGAVVVPAWRGRGIGAVLFRTAAWHARGRLGLPALWAGCDETNVRCERALLKAGYEPAAGPATYVMAGGRRVATRWFRAS